jgi:peptidoglycan/LPS O-acetylase OafA/YrhL
MKYRLPVLDLLRWFLATYVIMFHFWAWTKEDAFWQTKKLTAVFLQYGYLSVDMFFIISGIAIAASTSNKSSSDFFASRIRRLIPTFIFVSLIETSVTVGMYLRGDTGGSMFSILSVSAKNLLPVSGDDAALRNFVAWSLAVEVIFYALVWVGIVISVRLGSTKSREIVYFSRILLGILYIIGFAELGALSRSSIIIYLPYFILGANLWCLFSDNKEIYKPWLLDFIILVPLLFKTVSSRLSNAEMPKYEIIGASICVLVFVAILLSLVIKIPSLNNFSKILGNASYALYLLGGFTSIILFTEAKVEVGIFKAALFVYLLSCMVALLYQTFLDKKFQKILFKKIS